jgi:hypothetical protein
VFELVQIFVEFDEFCKNNNIVEFLLSNKYIKRQIKKTTLSHSELMTIFVLYHNSRFKDFKSFYYNSINLLIEYFPNLPSYKRLFVLQRHIEMPLLMYIEINKGTETGIYYIDSTPLPVCKNQRINNHKTFKGIAERGKTSMGWFYGFKLHLIINDKQEIMGIKITKGNVFDNQIIDELSKDLKGKLFGDRGYISKKEKLKELEERELILITKSRKNMKIKQEDSLSEEDKSLLLKRNIVETVIGKIKSSTNIVSSKIKNFKNYIVNVLSSVCSYIVNNKLGIL